MEDNQVSQSQNEDRNQPSKSEGGNRAETQKVNNKFLSQPKLEEDENLSGEISGDNGINMDAVLSTGGDLAELSDGDEEIKEPEKNKQKSHAENVGGTSEDDVRMGRD